MKAKAYKPAEYSFPERHKMPKRRMRIMRRALGIVAAAGLGLAALVSGCKSESKSTPEADHTGEKAVIISPRCIKATEKIERYGVYTDYIRWCQDNSSDSATNSGESILSYWVNNLESGIDIYANGSISNPSIYMICVPFDGCFSKRENDFQSYIEGATKAWQNQCERFNCKELEEKWNNGEFNYDPFEF